MKFFKSVGNALVKLWKNQPLRTVSYTATGLVLAVLYGDGLISANLDNILYTVAGLVLVGGGTELVHTQVTPVNGNLVGNLLSQLTALAKPPTAPPKA